MNKSDLELGKATSASLENLHGKIYRVYNNSISKIEESNRDLTKEDLALLKQAQSFVKDNGIEVDIAKRNGGNSLNERINSRLKNRELE